MRRATGPPRTANLSLASRRWKWWLPCGSTTICLIGNSSASTRAG